MTCKECDGSGIILGDYCPECDGSGQPYTLRLLGCWSRQQECDGCGTRTRVIHYEGIHDGSEWWYCIDCSHDLDPTIINPEWPKP